MNTCQVMETTGCCNIRLRGARVMIVYAIRVKGHLDLDWSACFNDLTISYEEDGSTLLCDPLADEAPRPGVATLGGQPSGGGRIEGRRVACDGASASRGGA